MTTHYPDFGAAAGAAMEANTAMAARHTADPVRPTGAHTPDTTADSTPQRRDLTLTLLSRFERGVITDAERPLLRPLVEAEMRHGQATVDQYVAQAPWLKAAAEDYEALQQRFTDLREETRRQGRVYEQTVRRLNRVRAQASDWSRLAPAGDTGMTPADTAFAEAGRIILGIADEATSPPGGAVSS